MGGLITADLICMVAGPFIAIAVSAFRRIEIVNRYPKVFAFIISAVVALVEGLTVGNFDMVKLAACLLVPFAGAVATYEVAKKPMRALAGQPDFDRDLNGRR